MSAKLSRFGITRVADVTGLDTLGIPVYVCMRPNAKSLSVSQGKGIDRDHAKVSAIMEAIELYHAENVALPRVRGSHRELQAKRPMLDPKTLSLHPNGRYHHGLTLDWVAATDIARSEEVLVPYDLVHCDFVSRPDRDPPSFVSGSNGLASGNHGLEATSHAICELLERDATANFWRRGCFSRDRINEFLIDFATVDDPCFLELEQRIRAAGLLLFAWDETTELGVAAIGCAIIDPRLDSPCAVYCGGHGCHVSREIALSRAVTEAAQSRLTEISGARDDLRLTQYRPAHCCYKRRSALDSFAHARPAVDFRSIPSFATDDIAADVALLLEQLRRCGYDRVAVADLSDPELGIAVVRAIIPGIGSVVGNQALPRRSFRQAS